MCWTTNGEVRRVGPEAGRFVEALESLRPSWVCTLCSVVCFSYFRYHIVMWDLDQETLCNERVGSWMVVNTWWYERGGSYPVTLVWGYEWVGSYVLCSHLRDVASGEVRSWWITCVGLRAGRSVEQDYGQVVP